MKPWKTVVRKLEIVLNCQESKWTTSHNMATKTILQSEKNVWIYLALAQTLHTGTIMYNLIGKCPTRHVLTRARIYVYSDNNQLSYC